MKSWCDPYMLGLLFFFFNDTATTEIYTLSLHDALPISAARLKTIRSSEDQLATVRELCAASRCGSSRLDRKSTRLNSSHPSISYAVFCLKKKKIIGTPLHLPANLGDLTTITLDYFSSRQ